MWKKLQKYLPNKEKFFNEKPRYFFSKHLHHPELWEFKQHTSAKGTACGLLVAFLPFPGQTVFAALLAYLCRANLAIAIAMTWITNPITFVPINYFIYKVGQSLLRDNHINYPSATLHWKGTNINEMSLNFWHWLVTLGKPFLIGSIVVSIASAFLGYLLVHGGWQLARIWNRSR